jgi:hypothetical protein
VWGYWDIGIQQIWRCCKHQKPWIRLGRDEANSEYKLNCLVFQATSPSGRFVDGAAAVHGHVLSHIEAHGKHIFYLSLFLSCAWLECVRSSKADTSATVELSLITFSPQWN